MPQDSFDIYDVNIYDFLQTLYLKNLTGSERRRGGFGGPGGPDSLDDSDNEDYFCDSLGHTSHKKGKEVIKKPGVFSDEEPHFLNEYNNLTLSSINNNKSLLDEIDFIDYSDYYNPQLSSANASSSYNRGNISINELLELISTLKSKIKSRKSSNASLTKFKPFNFDFYVKSDFDNVIQMPSPRSSPRSARSSLVINIPFSESLTSARSSPRSTRSFPKSKRSFPGRFDIIDIPFPESPVESQTWIDKLSNSFFNFFRNSF